MKQHILLFLLLYISGGFISVKAQIAKISNILSSNWSNNGTDKIYKYNPCIGIEYLENNYFILSSNISLSNKAQKYSIVNNNILEANIQYIELNTTARFKLMTKKTSFFIGVGPSIGWKTKSKYKIHGDIKENTSDHGNFIAKKSVINLVTEVGAYKDFSKYRIELFTSYETNITNVIPESRKGFIGHSLALNISLGYQL
jgi:hypothetical protein